MSEHHPMDDAAREAERIVQDAIDAIGRVEHHWITPDSPEDQVLRHVIGGETDSH